LNTVTASFNTIMGQMTEMSQRGPYGVLMLRCGYVQSEWSQCYESSVWQADSSKVNRQTWRL